jgi:hypothetical protein
LTEGRANEKDPKDQADGENEGSNPDALVFLNAAEHLAKE